MLATERHRRILQLLNDRTTVSVNFLLGDLRVTPMTLWRDLKHLEERHLLKRIRGGAMRVDVEQEQSFDVKSDAARSAKLRLARFAAKHYLTPGNIVALEGGTTVTELARQFPAIKQTVLTNSLSVINELRTNHRQVTTYCSGGLLREESGTFVGKEALTFFSRRKVNTFFMSATGFDLEAGLTDPNPMEIEVKQAMLQSAERVIVLMDSSKLGCVSLMEVAPLRKIAEIVTEKELPKAYQEVCQSANVRVRVAR